ncbi:MAG: hypothetical protein GF355_04975 [Candidatus Eisenbacteria bacterium]|nr:hypothetical protein [Candidatus Eisenbacteria bacterium]
MSEDCPSCGHAVAHRPRYCPGCGSFLFARCWCCGDEVFLPDRFCGSCGSNRMRLLTAVKNALAAETLLLNGQITEARELANSVRDDEYGVFFDFSSWDDLLNEVATLARLREQVLAREPASADAIPALNAAYKRVRTFIHGFPVSSVPLTADLRKDGEAMAAHIKETCLLAVERIWSQLRFDDALDLLHRQPAELCPSVDLDELKRQQGIFDAAQAFVRRKRYHPTTGERLRSHSLLQQLSDLPGGVELESLAQRLEEEQSRRRRNTRIALIVLGVIAVAAIVLWSLRSHL